MGRRLPPLNALRAFEAAARHGGFVAAAAELGVTPAAISQQVKGLEAQLDTALFRRAPQGLTLTEAGRAYLPGLSDGLDRLAEATSRLASASGGRVTISLLPALASGWLIPRLENFRRAFPGTALKLDTTRRLTDFAREDVDMVIRFGPRPAPGASKDLVAHHLMDEDVYPVASPAMRLGGRDLGDLAPHMLLHDSDIDIGPLPPQPWLQWANWYRRIGLPPPDPAAGIGFTDSSVLLAAALAGQGVALGRAPHLGDLLARGHLVRIGQQSWKADWAYHVVAPEAHFRRPLLRAVLDWLLAQRIQPDMKPFAAFIC